MMSRGIVQSLASSDDWNNFANRFSHSGYYLEGTDIFVHLRGLGRTVLDIGDISNAYRRGKECVCYTLTGKEFDSIYRALSKVNYDIEAMLLECQSIDFEATAHSEPFDDVTISKSLEKGVSSFSPFLLDRLKPLKAIPKKWTINHVIRLLANDQFESLCTTGIYTDDYAGDAASDFRKGPVARDDMLLKLVERPRGWWFNGGVKDGAELDISCGSFDCKKCIVRLAGVAPATDTACQVVEEKISNRPVPCSPNHAAKPAGVLLQ